MEDWITCSIDQRYHKLCEEMEDCITCSMNYLSNAVVVWLTSIGYSCYIRLLRILTERQDPGVFKKGIESKRCVKRGVLQLL